jgi:hypothetical protein
MNYKSILLLVVVLWDCAPRRHNDMFTLMPSGSTSLDFKNELTETDSFNMIEYLYFNDGGGVAAGDINNDGLIDLYFSSNLQDNRLYLNKGQLVFEDITAAAGTAGVCDWTTGVSMADVNGDGLLDIYVCCLGDYKGKKGHNELFINNGDRTFTESAAGWGIDFIGFSVQAAFFDFDLDGDLDMYLVNNSVHTDKSYGDASLRNDFDPYAGDRLFRNDSDSGLPKFTDVTKTSGIYSSQVGYGLQASISDINNDGYPDIYVSNDFHENDYLYINDTDRTFTESITSMVAHTSRSSMGNDIADFNNDGLPDILVLDMLPEDEAIRKRSAGEDDFELYEIKLRFGYYYQFVRNVLQLNMGGNQFAEIGRLSGIYSTDWSWSPLFCDLDNDGLKDIFITNGIFRRANDLDYINFLSNEPMARSWQNTSKYPDKLLYEKMPLDSLVNYVYRNQGNFTFTNMASEWNMEHPSYSNGSCYADLDNDGDLELITNNINAEAFVYRNNAEKLTDNHYLKFRFKGDRQNFFGIGVKVLVYAGDKFMMAENFTSRGFQSSVPPILHFGLGTTAMADSVVIFWPGGYTEVLTDVSANQVVEADITRAIKKSHVEENIPAEEKIFTRVLGSYGIAYSHRENRFNDFTREPLMPHNLSSEGPCIAVGDVNGDRQEDVYIGGARGQVPGLFIRQGEGFIPSPQEAFWDAADYEDVDAVFLDADDDGDADLFVVSGGNEFSGNHPSMTARLYINDGFGSFQHARDNTPSIFHNGSCVRPNDFDNDGDIDLFLGSRSVPKNYGISPPSFLLENNGAGLFTDVTAEKSPGLSSAGMVTSAAWADFDQDGNTDLALAGEWMPVKIFYQEDGKFQEANDFSGLSATGGWWFSLQAGDIDLDGDIDLAAGNLGLNTMIAADEDHPAMLYVNDFDNNGILDPVIAHYRQGNYFPLASVGELVNQVNSLQRKYGSYSEFAGQSMEEIFSKEKLRSSVTLLVHTFQSGVLLNLGNKKFNMKPLQAEAQFSPVMDMVIDDFDGDSIPDILAAGNYYSVRPSMGRYDAGSGWFLRGRGHGEYNAIYPASGGFYIRGEVRDMERLEIKGEKYIIAGVNNEAVRLFRVVGENPDTLP